MPETEKAEVLSKLLSQVIKNRDDHMAEILLRFPQVVPDFPSRYEIKPMCISIFGYGELYEHYEEIPPIVIAAAFNREILVNSLLNTGKISIDSAFEASEVATALGYSKISQALFDFLGNKSNLTIREKDSSNMDIEL